MQLLLARCELFLRAGVISMVVVTLTTLVGIIHARTSDVSALMGIVVALHQLVRALQRDFKDNYVPALRTIGITVLLVIIGFLLPSEAISMLFGIGVYPCLGLMVLVSLMLAGILIWRKRHQV